MDGELERFHCDGYGARIAKPQIGHVAEQRHMGRASRSQRLAMLPNSVILNSRLWHPKVPRLNHDGTSGPMWTSHAGKWLGCARRSRCEVSRWPCGETPQPVPTERGPSMPLGDGVRRGVLPRKRPKVPFGGEPSAGRGEEKRLGHLLGRVR